MMTEDSERDFAIWTAEQTQTAAGEIGVWAFPAPGDAGRMKIPTEQVAAMVAELIRQGWRYEKRAES